MSKITQLAIELADASVDAKRKGCARIAENRASVGIVETIASLNGREYADGYRAAAEAIARAIRARGGQP